MSNEPRNRDARMLRTDSSARNLDVFRIKGKNWSIRTLCSAYFALVYILPFLSMTYRIMWRKELCFDGFAWKLVRIFETISTNDFRHLLMLRDLRKSSLSRI